MNDRLKEKLWTELVRNYPDLLLKLQQENGVTKYLNESASRIETSLFGPQEVQMPDYLVEGLCIEELIKGTGPSRFSYILEILEEEFENDYLQLRQSGVLIYEVVNMMNECEQAFELLGFPPEEEPDRRLRYAVMGTISDYLIQK